VKKLVTSVVGASPVQIRSRCAILLCSVYGFRVGEVCRLRLEDIDWAEEKIFLRRPKQRKVQTYPLTTEVGNALLRYLKEARPRCAQREVFVTPRRPYRPVSVGALSTMTQKLQKRLGLKLKRYGSHVLRHACAINDSADAAAYAKLEAEYVKLFGSEDFIEGRKAEAGKPASHLPRSIKRS